LTRRHIPEYGILHGHRYENLNSYNLNFHFLAKGVPTHKFHAVSANWMERVCKGRREMSRKRFVI
jgi:hypothetical protein